LSRVLDEDEARAEWIRRGLRRSGRLPRMHPRIEELLRYCDECRAELRTAVDEVPAVRQRIRPSEGRWSVAEIVQHLAIVEARITEMFRMRIETAIAEGLARETETGPVLADIDVPKVVDRRHRIAAGKGSQPAQDLGTEEAWAALERAGRTFREVVARADGYALGTLSAPHPLLGPLTFYGWIAFTGAHELRHAAQIRENGGSPEAS
jgi:DinB superfamily